MIVVKLRDKEKEKERNHRNEISYHLIYLCVFLYVIPEIQYKSIEGEGNSHLRKRKREKGRAEQQSNFPIFKMSCQFSSFHFAEERKKEKN